MIYKKCDKCKKRRSLKSGKIKRACFMLHFPYYSYFGFDLCDDCLKKLEARLNYFFKEMKGGKVKNGSNTNKNNRI